MFNAIVLTKDEQGVHARVQALDEALAPGNVSGPRYNPATMSTIDCTR